MIRGHRRLLSIDMDPSQSITENSSTNIAPSPSSSPTLVVGTLPLKLQQRTHAACSIKCMRIYLANRSMIKV